METRDELVDSPQEGRRLGRREWTILAVFAFLTVGGLFLFLGDSDETLNQTPVGTLESSEKIARRHGGRLQWGFIPNQSSLYDGDTLLAGGSGATVRLADGTSLGVSPYSMVRISTVDQDTLGVTLVFGSFVPGTPGASAGSRTVRVRRSAEPKATPVAVTPPTEAPVVPEATAVPVVEATPVVLEPVRTPATAAAVPRSTDGVWRPEGYVPMTLSPQRAAALEASRQASQNKLLGFTTRNLASTEHKTDEWYRFDWRPLPGGATRYELQLSREPSFEQTAPLETKETFIQVKFPRNGVYYIRVMAEKNGKRSYSQPTELEVQ